MKPDPGLIPFLKVNDPLPDWLLTRLDTYLEHRAQRIQFCQDEAARLRREAESLEHESRRLRFQSDIYAPLRNPMRRIPPEILAKIMHSVLGGPGCFVDQWGRVEFLHLRQVAKEWRRTAYSTPSLWRFLSIDLEDFPGLAAGPSVALVTLTRRLDWWFGHAGRNAEVHLDLGIDRYPWPEKVSWIGSMWGPNARRFQLVTVQLWGQLVLGPDVREEYPSMESLKNLSVSERVSGLEKKFPALESLKFSMLSIRAVLDRPIRHSQLRSLFLSCLSLEQHSFAPILEQLPMLEELILDSCDYSNIPLTYATPSIVNTSLRRLVATGSVLSRWRSVSFPSLQFCQLIPNTNSEFLLRWDKGYTDEVLYLIAEFLGECNAPNVTLDLTRASISPAEIASLLSSIPALRSLRLASNAAIFSNEAKHWRTKPNVKHVVCERYLPVPDTFRTIPLPRVLNGLEQAVIIHVPSDPQANKPSYFLCSEIKGMVIPSPMNLVCLPESQMAAILRDEFPIRNHEYEALRNDLDPGAL